MLISIITIFQLFSAYINSIILYFFSGAFSYKGFSFVISLVSFILIFVDIVKKKGKINNKTLLIFLKMIIVMFLFIVTYVIFNAEGNLDLKSKNRAFSQFLVFVGQIIPSVIMACIVARENEIQEKIKKYIPYIALIFGIAALLSVIRPNSHTTAGYVLNEYSLNYQTASYVSSLSIAFCFFYLQNKNLFKNKILNNKFTPFIFKILIFVNLFTIMLAGGRGGFILAIIYIFISVWISYGRKKIDLSLLFKRIFTISISIILIIFIVNTILEYDFNFSGFNRIISLLEGTGDPNRIEKIKWAIESFYNRPIFGHGIGSIFYLYGHYTHNFFTDAIVESGIIGVFISLYLFIYSFLKSLRLARIDSSENIWLYILLFGLTMSLFSGYYLSHVPIFWMYAFLKLKKVN